jgi:hypothetical protein
MTNTKPLFGFDLDRDVRAVDIMSERLKPYIYEDELYGVMPGDLPRLTIGGLLMRLHRLAAVKDMLTPAQQNQLQQAQERFEQMRTEWRVAYENKIKQELQSRTTSLEQFLNECSDNLRSCADNYPSAMEKRVIIEGLLQEAQNLGSFSSDLNTRITALDNKIHRYAQDTGVFIWDTRLTKAYPHDRYWFLYSTVPTNKTS